MDDYKHVQKQDKEVFDALVGEEHRESEGLELIPSENYVSKAVREANGSCLTNKYSEGYPGKRYYGGQTYTDMVETLAIERAKQLFNCGYANVQTLGGANANIAMYFALLQPGDTVLGMDLSHGGHLTHGHPVTYLTKIFNFVRYKMKDVETGEIDYDEMLKVAKEHKPKIVLAGFSAYPRELNYQKFVDIAREVGAYAVMDIAHIAGLIAGKAVKSPFDFGFDVMTSTTHKTLRGPRGGLILTRESEEIAKKIDKMVFPGLQGGPHLNQIAAVAVALAEAARPEFKKYTKQVVKNAAALAGELARLGWRIVSGGTDTHLLLVDVWMNGKGIGGKEASERLEKAGIIVNKNTIPFDTRSPVDPSGIRLGTPAETTRGKQEKDFTEIAKKINEVLRK